MSSPPADLLAFRASVRAATGLASNAVGIVGDGAHQRTGGYHEGVDVLRAIGRFHPPATIRVGSSGEDYSARLLRDRLGLTGEASAVDIGDDWPHAGRVAWLRYNGLLYAEMRDHPERLPALRAINVSLDGRSKRRYDQQHRADGLTVSTDTVTTHTHHEYYRDTAGKPARVQTLSRQLQLIAAAVAGAAVVAASGEDDDMKFLVRHADSPAVFLTDGITARLVASEEELADVRTLHHEGLVPLADGGEVRVVGRRELVGRIVGTVPAGFEALAATPGA